MQSWQQPIRVDFVPNTCQDFSLEYRFPPETLLICKLLDEFLIFWSPLIQDNCGSKISTIGAETSIIIHVTQFLNPVRSSWPVIFMNKVCLARLDFWSPDIFNTVLIKMKGALYEHLRPSWTPPLRSLPPREKLIKPNVSERSKPVVAVFSPQVPTSSKGNYGSLC